MPGKYYGYRWRKAIRPRILERDGNRCTVCAEPHPRLNCAHRNRVAGDDREENLFALCPSCHGKYDAPVAQPKAKQARVTRKDAARPLLREMSA